MVKECKAFLTTRIAKQFLLGHQRRWCLFYRIGNSSYSIKNAPRGSHCGGIENVAIATRRRRRVSQAKLFVPGLVVLKVKGWHTNLYQDIVGFGYGFFYLYIMMTSPGTLAFTYILPLMSMLIIYKNRNFIIRCGVLSVIIIVATIIRNYMNGMNTPSDISNFEIQFAIIVFCYVGYIIAINHLITSDGAMLDSVKDNLARVITTVEQVKGASNVVVDGVVVDRCRAHSGRIPQSV